METNAGLQPTPDEIVTQTLASNPDISAGEVGRIAFYAARAAGYSLLAATGIEARVLEGRKRELRESVIRRTEWLIENRPAFEGAV